MSTEETKKAEEAKLADGKATAAENEAERAKEGQTQKNNSLGGLKARFGGRGKTPDGAQDAQNAQQGAGNGAKKKGRKKKKLGKKQIILIGIAAFAAAFAVSRVIGAKNRETETAVDAKNIAAVQRGSISNELTSSGTLSAKDSYTITSLVEGEIIEANFEEGDQVEKGQVLYRIDPTDVEQEIETAQRNVESAQKTLKEAQEDETKAKKKFGNGTYTAKKSGYVKNLSLKSGDKVGGNGASEIAELYNDSTMKLRLPFLSTEADAIAVGTNMIVTLSDTGEQISGQVSEKSALTETLAGGTTVKYLTILVANPGGLSSSDTATAQCGDIYSAGDGTFEAYTSEKLSVDLPASVEVSRVLVTEGQYVSAGTPLFTMTADSLSDALQTYSDAVDKAEDSLENAEDTLSTRQDSLEDYTITAPISGQVILKSKKAGDKIDRSNSSSDSTLAIIYDLSELTFEMSIDELDISKVEVRQEVKITADAFEDEQFSGHVTNVSLNGSYSNGVTTYPVTVTLDEMDDLLPSMNVDGTIILEEAEDVLYIPANALQRGNIVYVKDSSLTDDQKAGTADSKAQQSGSTSDARSAAGSDAAMPEGAPEQQAAGGAVARSNAPEGFTAVRVETGLVSDDYVEITSGLSEGQEVYVKDSASGSSNMMFMGGGPGGMGGGPGGGAPGGGGRPGGM